MELWGGHECTVNRVGDVYRDQTRLTGHEERVDDLARFAGLGLRRLRYPVLWERVAPASPGARDWRWSDERLAEIRRLGMAPIVGLLHHGSGPEYTSLVADDFVPLFVDYAAAAAERYPWVDDWTPINEPLTTARFSALYGHWYPHARDERLFWVAVLNQVEATIGAMAAIRRVNPAARLVQTEDLGDVFSTPQLAGHADHLRHRRWISWDLLAGRVVPGHALWEHLDRFGFAERLRAIADSPCPPDVVGVNHYVTSDRFLDHRAELYDAPLPPAGYHDVTAARVLDPAPPGLASVVRQAWERYGIPVAVTEAHLGCTRDEQLRWLWQAWQACADLRRDGVDVRAVTAWSLLGSVDWDSLITVAAGHYECGAFDVRGAEPRATAVARLLPRLGAGNGPLPHPVVAGRGWWQRDELRLEHRPFASGAARPPSRVTPPGRPILITGATGTLGQALAGACRLRGLSHVLTDRATLALDDLRSIARALDRHKPWAVINAAGWVRVDDAEGEEAACMSANASGAAALAAACAARGIHHTAFSSDLVFDGTAGRPYAEDDVPKPLNAYGRSKAAAEAAVLGADGLVVRTAAFFSPYDEHNFAVHLERALRAGRPFTAADGFVVTPTFVPHLVAATLDLVIDDATGLWHLTNGEALSWFDFGRRVAAALDLPVDLVRAATPRELGWRAERPRQAALTSLHGRLLPGLDEALAHHAERRASFAAAAQAA